MLCSVSVAAQAPTAPGQSILVMGDSLSAEYGLQRGTGWVKLLEERLEKEKSGYRVVNSSISGDTTSGGVTRLPAALKQYQPALVIIELGSNDALRGLALDMTRENLQSMIDMSTRTGAKVLLVGMQIPPNYGPRYTQAFRALFDDLAKQNKTGLVPFLLEGMATNRSLFQSDGMHPNESGQPILADNVWKALKPML